MLRVAKKYAPKQALNMTFGETGPVPAQGEIAQQIFWYTAFTADVTKPGLLVVNADGTPKWWRMAPGPNGPYWKQGMQNGYKDNCPCSRGGSGLRCWCNELAATSLARWPHRETPTGTSSSLIHAGHDLIEPRQQVRYDFGTVRFIENLVPCTAVHMR